MKIKCHLCNSKVETEYNEVELLEHFRTQHDKILIASDSIVRIFKIHEKIEKYDDGIWFHTFPQHTTSEVLVSELKSLLENDNEK